MSRLGAGATHTDRLLSELRGLRAEASRAAHRHRAIRLMLDERGEILVPDLSASNHNRDGARAFLRALWSEPALQDFDVSEIAGVALLPEGMRAWALEALKGKEGAAYPIVMYNAVNKVPKYDHKGLHFKRNYPIDCKTCKTGKKEGKPARLSDDGPPKKKGKQSQLSFAKPSSK